MASTDPTPTTRIAVRVQPGARKPGLVGRHGEAWRVRVAAPPVGGRANAAVVELLAEVLGIRVRDISVVHGMTGRSKLLEIRGLEAREVDERLDRFLG